QIEAEGDRRELLLVRDRQRRRGVHEAREGRQRHLIAGGDGVGGCRGVGIGAAARGVAGGGGGAVAGAGAGDVELAERSRVLLVARLRLQDDAVLIGL